TSGDAPLDGATYDDFAPVGPHRGRGAHIPAAAPVDPDPLELPKHLGDPVRLGGPARRADAGRAIEGVDLDARVVGQAELAGGARERTRLDERVLLERRARLLGAGVARLDHELVPEGALHLLDLVQVAGREQDPGHRGSGGTLTISRCSSMMAPIPSSARP